MTRTQTAVVVIASLVSAIASAVTAAILVYVIRL